MTAVIPARFLFRWAWPVRRIDDLPAATGRLLDLPEQARCFPLVEVDGIAGFADLRLAWNLHGIGLAVHVQGKQQPLKCHPLTPTASDGVTFWLDTRATQTVHRATKYCHQFCLLPGGAGQKKDKPSVTTLPMLRGSEDRLVASAKGSPSPIQIWSEIRADGYTLEAWLPAESLVGFDPEAQPQLGFYCLIRDAELGEQFLTVGRDFPFEHDPSLWQLLELSDA
jgi:hypothetical protein